MRCFFIHKITAHWIVWDRNTGTGPIKRTAGKGEKMDLQKILGGLENGADLIKQIESEVGKEFIPRSEFNAKNAEVKERDKQLGELKTQLDESAKGKADYDKTIAELTGKVSNYELSSLKARIAHEKGIPYELAGRLTGADEKSLREDAETLSKLVTKGQPTPPLKSNEPTGEGKDAPYKALLNGLKGE